MNRIIPRTGIAFVLALACQVALAQWVWKDDGGHTVYSDQPPPPGVTKAHIMKSPGAQTSDAVAAPTGSAADSSADGTSANHPKTLAEQDLDYKKRQKEAAETAKKKAEEDAKTAQNSQRCDIARQNLAQLQSGSRIQRTDDQGQRYYLDDAQRASEQAKIQQGMQGC